jgi:hypothetical protein
MTTLRRLPQTALDTALGIPSLAIYYGRTTVALVLAACFALSLLAAPPAASQSAATQQAAAGAGSAPPDLSAAGLEPVVSGRFRDGLTYAVYRSVTPVPDEAAAPVVSPDALGAAWEVWQPVSRVPGKRWGVTLRTPPPKSTVSSVPPVTVSSVPVVPAAMQSSAVKPLSSYLGTPATVGQFGVKPGPEFGVRSVGHTADQQLSDLSVSGFQQGFDFEAFSGGLALTNCRSHHSWSAQQYYGQGAYVRGVSGSITVKGCVFAYCGRDTSLAPAEVDTQFRHCWYGNSDCGPTTFDTCVFASPQNAGVQSRSLSGVRCVNCVFLDCGTAVLSVMGGCTLEHCTVYDGHPYCDGDAASGNWTGDAAIQALWPVVATDVHVVGRRGQGKPTPQAAAKRPRARLFQQGAVVTGGTWANAGGEPPWTAPRVSPGTDYLAGSSGCVVCRWLPSVPAFAGARPSAGPGWTVLGAGQPATADYDWRPAVGRALAARSVDGPGGVAAIVAELHQAIRAQESR